MSWKVLTLDERAGIVWWNGLSEAEQLFWLDCAWRRNNKTAGRVSYRFDDMPSVADAWAAWKDSNTVVHL